MTPQCVLHELQTLADSQHLSKRTRGKRGLEMLSQLQQLQNLELRVIDDWEPMIQTVDHQLIAIAKKRGAKIVTNELESGQNCVPSRSAHSQRERINIPITSPGAAWGNHSRLHS